MLPERVDTLRMQAAIKLLVSVALSLTLSGCAMTELLFYVLNPDYPRFHDGEVVRLTGLAADVDVARREDGLWRIEAENELDAMTAVGYLQARDRLAQMDLLRHIARGEVAAMLGDRVVAGKPAVESDRLGRFLGFRDNATKLIATTSAEERAAGEAFVRGVNAWIATGQRSLEHRLLGIESVRPWTVEDSIAIYLFLMHSLTGNADREIRRLLIACEAGIEAMERIWPTDIEFDVAALPEDAWPAQTYPPQPGVVAELRDELAKLCPSKETPRITAASARNDFVFDDPLSRLVQAFRGGIAASNNWVVAGNHTRSGKPIVSNDPHLPHMNPPLVWGMEVKFPGLHVAGFALAGLHRVVFGHNGHVAWGATTNFVDRQDLVLHRPLKTVRDGETVDGYEVEGELVPFERRTEKFEVRDGAAVETTVRFTKDGPLLNDIEPFIAHKVPLVALRVTPLGRGTDLDAGRAMNYARNAAELEAALAMFDQGCSNWVFADADGNIGYRSPCVTPLRAGYRGTFPIPGWLRRYEWSGFYPKEELPKCDNPQRGWLATANSRVIPANRLPSPYNNDESGPDRVMRIEQRLRHEIDNGGLTPAASSAIQMDLSCNHWPSLRAGLQDSLCRSNVDADDNDVARARRELCGWDGVSRDDSVAATIHTLLTNAVLDRAMSDDLPGGKDDKAWRFAQTLFQFEANVQRMWRAPVDAPFWDDVRTAKIETRSEILEAALIDAVAGGKRLHGNDINAWRLGRVRPFLLAHAFAANGGPLGAVLNGPAMSIGGDTETPFKQQFLRSDREHMRPTVGPLIRLTVDLADPWAATYSMAGGESGWPQSPWYANLLDDWRVGRARPLTPADDDSDIGVKLIPET
jgi:penicillin amidase